MAYNNPFINSNDNKRYYTWNYYLKQTYHCKVFKVALNAGFSCPNRDGKISKNGCTFCSALGSGDYAGNVCDSLDVQYQKGLTMMQKKWPNGSAIAYFQAFTNTYASLEHLKSIYNPFVFKDDIKAISIATRCDCLDQEKINYFDSLCEHKDLWIELGLQTIHDETASRCNRGHTYQEFLNCIEMLKGTRIKICVHLINSLPYESKEMMLESAKAIANLPIHAVKIHMLHIIEGSTMAKEYKQNPFPLLSKEDYIDIVIKQLEVLPEHFIIQRLTGDGVKEDLIAPLWTLKKVIVLNDIDKEMVKRNTYQGKYYKKTLAHG